MSSAIAPPECDRLGWLKIQRNTVPYFAALIPLTQDPLERPISRSDATEIRILDAAWDLVRERGVHRLRVSDVAAAAGVSRQSVYLHFENRTGLLAEMTRRHLDPYGLDKPGYSCPTPLP